MQGEKENFEESNFIWTQWAKEKHFNALDQNTKLQGSIEIEIEEAKIQ
jgi:hypothetical protein